MSTTLNPPGPKGLPLIGSLLDFHRDKLRFISKIAEEFGDIAYFRLGPRKVFLLNHPDLIKDVLVIHHDNFLKSRSREPFKNVLGQGLLTSEKDFHIRQRRLIQPSFHHKRISAYANMMVDYASRMSEQWADGNTIEMNNEMTKFTIAIVAKALFDVDVETETEEIGALLSVLSEKFPPIMLLFPEILEKFPLPRTRRLKNARSELDRTIYGMIDERRRTNIDRGDFLSMLLSARDANAEGSKMTDLQVRDEAITISLAGLTTSNALTWTWYLLSKHPDAEKNLHDELDTVLEGRLPNMADLETLPYTRMVFTESMRLYPPVWLTLRNAINDYEVGGYLVPSGASIFMSQYVMHRDSRYFPDPLLFDPERWTPENQATRPKFSYFPFGAGPRSCIGERFAWMEGVLIIATLAKNWSLRLVPRQKKVEPNPGINLRPKYGINMLVQKR